MSYDPIPAGGAGAERFDLPSLFYLTNRVLIEEWASLRTNVAEALGDWYRHTLRDTLAGEAADRGLDVSEARGPSGYHHIVLHPPETPILAGKAVVGVGLGWPSKSVNPAATSTFVCVRCSRNQTGRNAAELFMNAGGRAYRTATPEAKAGDHDAWPIYWWVRGSEQWWADLDSYCATLVEEILRMTDALREPLTAAARVNVTGSADELE